jgi:hypothetical protein
MDYTSIPDERVTDLILLVHDKGHLQDAYSALVPIFEKHTMTCSVPLYRGLTREQYDTLKRGGHIKGWMSFTEDRSVAEHFARTRGTGLASLPAGSHGFSLVDCLEHTLTDSEKANDDGAVPELYRKEREWLVNVDFG